MMVRTRKIVKSGDWVTLGRYPQAPKAQVRWVGFRYTWAVDEEGKRVILRNIALYNSDWIKTEEDNL